MLSVLRGGRSLLSVLLVGLYFLLMSPVLRLVVIPWVFFFPRERFRVVSLWMKAMSARHSRAACASEAPARGAWAACRRRSQS